MRVDRTPPTRGAIDPNSDLALCRDGWVRVRVRVRVRVEGYRVMPRSVVVNVWAMGVDC